MIDIIRNMLQKASDEEDLDLADIASDLLEKLSSTYNCPSDWRSIKEDLYTEFQDNEWLVNAVYEFSTINI